MWTWNSFLLPLIMVSKEGLNTVPLGLIFFQGRYNVQYNLLAAASVLVACRSSAPTSSPSGTSSPA